MTPTTMILIIIFVGILMVAVAAIFGRICGASAAHYPERPIVQGVYDGIERCGRGGSRRQ